MFNEQGQFVEKDSLSPSESQIIQPVMLIKHFRNIERMVIESASQNQLDSEVAMQIVKDISDICLKLNASELSKWKIKQDITTKKKY